MTELENPPKKLKNGSGLNGIRFQEPHTVFGLDDKATLLAEEAPLVKLSGSPYYPNGGPEAPSNQKIENYGDFIVFGKYTILFMIMYEFLMLPQMGNMTFMLYGGTW